MSEKEKEVTKEVIDNLHAVPKDGESFVRGYLKGMLDGIDVVKERKKESVGNAEDEIR